MKKFCKLCWRLCLFTYVVGLPFFCLHCVVKAHDDEETNRLLLNLDMEAKKFSVGWQNTAILSQHFVEALIEMTTPPGERLERLKHE